MTETRDRASRAAGRVLKAFNCCAALNALRGSSSAVHLTVARRSAAISGAASSGCQWSPKSRAGRAHPHLAERWERGSHRRGLRRGDQRSDYARSLSSPIRCLVRRRRRRDNADLSTLRMQGFHTMKIPAKPAGARAAEILADAIESAIERFILAKLRHLAAVPPRQRRSAQATSSLRQRSLRSGDSPPNSFNPWLRPNDVAPSLAELEGVWAPDPSVFWAGRTKEENK